jgi:hypothetical protein
MYLYSHLRKSKKKLPQPLQTIRQTTSPSSRCQRLLYSPPEKLAWRQSVGAKDAALAVRLRVMHAGPGCDLPPVCKADPAEFKVAAGACEKQLALPL